MHEPMCTNHPYRKAIQTTMVEGEITVYCCQVCVERQAQSVVRRDRFYCKLCRVPVVSAEDTSALLERQPHKEWCPRHPDHEDNQEKPKKEPGHALPNHGGGPRRILKEPK